VRPRGQEIAMRLARSVEHVHPATSSCAFRKSSTAALPASLPLIPSAPPAEQHLRADCGWACSRPSGSRGRRPFRRPPTSARTAASRADAPPLTSYRRALGLAKTVRRHNTGSSSATKGSVAHPGARQPEIFKRSGRAVGRRRPSLLTAQVTAFDRIVIARRMALDAPPAAAPAIAR
jgi:hypothetical protein